MSNFHYDTEIEKFFPEEEGPIEPGTVVKHSKYPVSTIGIVAKKSVDEDSTYFRGKLARGLNLPSGSFSSEKSWRYEVDWQSPPPRSPFLGSGSFLYTPYVPLQVTPSIFSFTSGSV